MATPEDKPETKRELALLSWIQQFTPYGVLTLDASLRVQTWNRWLESHSSLNAEAVARAPVVEQIEERLLPRARSHRRALDRDDLVALSDARRRHSFSRVFRAIRDIVHPTQSHRRIRTCDQVYGQSARGT